MLLSMHGFILSGKHSPSIVCQRDVIHNQDEEKGKMRNLPSRISDNLYQHQLWFEPELWNLGRWKDAYLQNILYYLFAWSLKYSCATILPENKVVSETNFLCFLSYEIFNLMRAAI